MSNETETQIIARYAAWYIEDYGDYAEHVDASKMTDEELWQVMTEAGVRLNLNAGACMEKLGASEELVLEVQGDVDQIDERVKAAFIAAQRARQVI